MSVKGRTQKDKRVGGGYLCLPWQVLNSAAYRSATHTERSLLIDIGRQYSGNNNGMLVSCMKYLRGLGWNSHDTVTRNLRHLIERGLLMETRKGGFPNKAAWHALTWYDLDVMHGLDIDHTKYKRGAYALFKDNDSLVPCKVTHIEA
jgi:hypothetical protein